jgi:predicted helicase
VNRSLEERAAEAGAQRDASLGREVRRVHGVVHTPAIVARWAVKRVDQCLRTRFGFADGIGDGRVVLLDPAVGTGVWLAAASSLARCVAPVTAIGVDVDANVLATAREVLSARCAELGWSLQLRHGNALAEAAPFETDPGVRVILGNPPWAARSGSRGTALSDAWLREFREEDDGSALREQRTGVLSDDYVRFFRWALEQARTAPHGAVVCFASNHSYLDGPVHRGMRRALAAVFDEIEVLDLGGNSLLSRGAGRDESVFGVRVGAAITVAVRRPGRVGRHASLSYTRLRGKKAEKLAALEQERHGTTTTFSPAPPSWVFVPARPSSEQRDTFSIAQALPFHREGVQTNRDALCVDVDRQALLARLWRVARGELQVPASRHFDPESARARLLARLTEDEDEVVTMLSYRPLDTRFVCTVSPICHRPRPDLLAACARSPLCLLSARKDRGDAPWSLLGITAHAADSCFLSTRSSCRTRVWPSLLADGRENLDERIADRLAQHAGTAVSSESLIAYVCGALSSPRYRLQHSDALKRDYPEVPWPRSAQAFEAFTAAGRLWMHAWLRPPRIPGANSICSALPGADVGHVTSTLGEQTTADTYLTVSAGTADTLVGHFQLLSVLSQRPGTHAWQLRDAHERALTWGEAGRLADNAHLTNRTV